MNQVNAPDYASAAMEMDAEGMEVSIYSIRKGELANAKSTLANLEPQQTEGAIRGKRIYVGSVEAPKTLDNARFMKIVAIGEGR